MSARIDLVIFHYHLSAGGVSSVIRLAARALMEHGGSIRRIRIVTGSPPDPPLSEPPARIPLESVVIPEIGYAAAPRGGAWGERAARLSRMLMERFSSPAAVWWIHNHHLGKNPVFTQAILMAAAAENPPRMILQPHDFPEAGRFSLLRDLDRLSLPMYPAGPAVRWAVINDRDLGILSTAEIPRSSLFLLHNPVPPLPPSADISSGRPSEIRAWLSGTRDSSIPMLLYPVRAIRRKNVMEACLLSLLPERPAGLLVTLPGTSRAERPYSRRVRRLFQSGAVTGEFAVGAQRPAIPLDVLAAASDLIVSSSIQEGFGYLFAQAVQWGIPLLARRIDVLPDLEDMFRDHPSHFYPALRCPLLPHERTALDRAYRRKLHRLSALIPADSLSGIEEEITRAFADPLVDFALLDAGTQDRIVRRAASRGDALSALRSANTEIVRSLEILLHAPRPAPRGVPQRHTPEAFVERFKEIISSFGTPVQAASDPMVIQARVRAAFARLEYLRLLYD